MAVVVFGQSLMFLFARSLEAMARVSVNLRIVFAESAMEAAASVAFVVLGGGATGAAFGRAAGYLFGAVMAVAITVRLTGLARPGLRSPSSGRIREISKYAAALLIVDGSFTLFSQIDTLLIGAIIGTAAVGIWTAPLRLIALLRYPSAALAAGVAPRLARRDGASQGAAELQASLRGLCIFQAFATGAVLVWATPLVALLLGPGYGGSADVLRALAPFIFLAGFAEVTSMGVNYLGQARRRVPIAIGAVAINVVVDLILIPRIGVTGAAIGTDLAYLLYVPAHFAICRREVGVALRPLAGVLARSILAAAALAAVLALGTLAFVSVLLITGELKLGSAPVRARGAARRALGLTS
jgi:O-antigen/teichoic acid export membrane protein